LLYNSMLLSLLVTKKFMNSSYVSVINEKNFQADLCTYYVGFDLNDSGKNIDLTTL